MLLSNIIKKLNKDFKIKCSLEHKDEYKLSLYKEMTYMKGEYYYDGFITILNNKVRAMDLPVIPNNRWIYKLWTDQSNIVIDVYIDSKLPEEI